MLGKQGVHRKNLEPSSCLRAGCECSMCRASSAFLLLCMDFVIWNYFLLFSPVLYSTLLFLAEIPPTALPWHILCGALEQHPEEVQAGGWVYLSGIDRASGSLGIYRIPRLVPCGHFED